LLDSLIMCVRVFLIRKRTLEDDTMTRTIKSLKIVLQWPPLL